MNFWLFFDFFSTSSYWVLDVVKRAIWKSAENPGPECRTEFSSLIIQHPIYVTDNYINVTISSPVTYNSAQRAPLYAITAHSSCINRAMFQQALHEVVIVNL